VWLCGVTTNMMAKASPNEFGLYQEVVQKIKEESLYPVDDKRLLDSCLDGVVNMVDKGGGYLNEEEYASFYDASKSAELGMSLFQRGSYFVIKTVMDDFPAAKAGLKRGDKVLKIEGKTLKQMSLKDVSYELKGAANTKVKLSILKKNSKTPIEIVLVRRLIDTDLITSKIIKNNIAHIKITAFSQTTLHEMMDDLELLYSQNHGKVSGMILDLRDNLGGFFSSGIAVTSLFLPNDVVILNVQSRKKEDKKQYKNTPIDYDGLEYVSKLENMKFLKIIPLVVLVNNDSAGSSEIVASILQEYGRATVVGTSSFGKDTFATIIPLTTKPSAIKPATARWTTPKGKSVWPNGVTPNIEVFDHSEGEDIQLQEALSVFDKK